MVDYNIAIPQQQLYQAPDFTQNAMRMQQMDQAQTQAVGLNKLREMQTRGLAQDQQLTALKMQATRQEMATAAAARAQAAGDKNALERAIRESVVSEFGPRPGPDLSVAANRLVAENRFGPAASALGMSKLFTEGKKATADLDKIDIDNLDKEVQVFKTMAPSVRTPEDAAMFVGAMAVHPRISKLILQMGTREELMDKARRDFANDPERWVTANVNLTGQQVVDTLKQTREQTNLGNVMSTQTLDAFKRPIGEPTEQTIGMTPKEAASIETPEQKLAYQADLQKQRARVDLELALPAAKSSVDATIGDIDAQIARIKNLREHKGLQYITGGIMGRIGSTGKEATSAQADLDQIIAKAGFDALQQMRNASPTGGALGNVSDREGKRLEASAAAMSQAQGTKAFKDKLDRFMADLERAKKSIKSAFDAQYAGVKSAPAKSDGWTIEEN